MLVSIIIPVCNGEKFMKQTLESVYAQSYKNFEVICVDDGSIDNTGTTIKDFDKRIIYYYSQNNKGQAAARNTAIGLSHGDLIAFLDADDIWFPDKLKLQIKYLLDHPDVAMVHSNISIVTNGSITTRELPIIKRHRNFSIFDELYLGNFVNTPTVVLRRECLNILGLFDEGLRRGEDYDLWLRVAANFKIGYQDVVTGIYRMHSDNISRDTIGMNIGVLNVLDKMKKLYPQHVSKIPKEKINNRYLRLSYSIGYEYFCKYDLVNARRYFLNALKFKKMSIPIYIYILSTYLNASMIDRIRIIKRKIRKYVN